MERRRNRTRLLQHNTMGSTSNEPKESLRNEAMGVSRTEAIKARLT